MPKEKRSFFGKIMGADLADEPGNGPVVDEDEADEAAMEMEELAEDGEMLEEETVTVEGEEEIEEVPVRTVETKPAPVHTETSQHEEWLSDYEGQLNIDMYQTKDN